MTEGLVTVSYIGATILFILALGGLSNQETASRGNMYGIAGMLIALVATILGVATANYEILIGALVVGGAIGVVLAAPKNKPHLHLKKNPRLPKRKARSDAAASAEVERSFAVAKRLPGSRASNSEIS